MNRRYPRPPDYQRRRPYRGRSDARLDRVVAVVLAVAVICGALGVVAIATDTFGAGQRWESVMARVDRFIAGPVPDRPAPSTRLVTEPPATVPPTPAPTVDASVDPDATPAPSPTPTPVPVRVPVDVDTVADPDTVFASQDHKDWCAVAGTQMVLALHGRADTSVATQKDIASRIREWESVSDSRNGNWGPAAMALALEAYGVPGYEVRAFETRQGALRDAARTLQATGAPVILLAWRGAHTWIMTGFQADGDPTIFRNARVTGAYVLDPWYPRISSIWGASDPPGTLQDEAELERNFLRWKRPEGTYPDRDGLYITVAPTVSLTSSAG